VNGQETHHPDSAVTCLLQVDDLTTAAQEAEAEAASVYEDEYIEFDPYLFIRKLPPLDAVVPASRVALLPRQVPRFRNCYNNSNSNSASHDRWACALMCIYIKPPWASAAGFQRHLIGERRPGQRRLEPAAWFHGNSVPWQLPADARPAALCTAPSELHPSSVRLPPFCS